jgi:ketosteroid isomerase-like protein
MNTTESEIVGLCKIYKDCVYRKDYAALLNIYHQDILAFDLWGDGMYEGKTDWSNSMKDWLSSLPENEKVEVSFELLNVEINEAVGFAYGFVIYTAIDQNNTELRKMKNRFSWGLVKPDNSWLISHQHTSVPIEFETTKAIFWR